MIFLLQTLNPEVEKIIEEIQSGSLPTNESLGEKPVDELIGVDNLARKDKRVGRLKRKFREMIVVVEFIKNENLLLKRFQCQVLRGNFRFEKGKKEFVKEGPTMV